MTIHKPLFCPQCNNKYSTLSECPECQIALVKHSNPSIHQTTQGDHNQTVVVGDNNEGSIIHAPTTINQPHSEVAKYHVNPIGSYPSFWHVIKNRVYMGAGIAGIGLFSWLSGWASILSWLGYSANTIELTENAVLLFVIIIFLILFNKIGDLFNIKDHKAYRIKGTVFVNQDDGSIQVYRVSGKCPIAGCPGDLYLGIPPKNLEDTGFAAMCTKHGYKHAFEFNDETLMGSRVKITPAPNETKLHYN